MSKCWVISDIHGCIHTLRTLIENQIVPSKEDKLIFLGDYIDRGPGSKSVLDYVMQLEDNGYSIIALKGNHEEFLVKAYETQKQLKNFWFYKETNRSLEMWMRHGGKEALESFEVNDVEEIPSHYIDWINKRPLYYETEKFFVVHAGLNFEIDNPFEDEQAMTWIREYKVVPEKINFRRLIHGHVPVSLDFIDLTIKSSGYPFIDLDNGCYMANKPGFGNLIGLELNSMELKVQSNLDFE